MTLKFVWSGRNSDDKIFDQKMLKNVWHWAQYYKKFSTEPCYTDDDYDQPAKS